MTFTTVGKILDSKLRKLQNAGRGVKFHQNI